VKVLHRFRPSLVALVFLCVGAALGFGCKDSADVRVRIDTTGWETVRVELSGELHPLISDGKPPQGLRPEMVRLWGDRMTRGKDSGLFVVSSAKDLTEGTTPKTEGQPFVILVEGQVAPPCNEDTAWPFADKLWEVMSHQGDFGFYRISSAATASAAMLLRTHPGVLDVSTRAELRGFTVVKAEGGADQATSLLEFLGPRLLDGMAIQIPPAAIPGDLRLDPGDLVFAVLEPKPFLDEGAVASAEPLPARDGIDGVNIRFTTIAVPTIASVTDAELGRHFVVLHDRGQFLTAPIIGSRVRDGQLEIRMKSDKMIGLPTSQRIAAVLGSGGLTAMPYLHKLRVTCVKTDGQTSWLERHFQ